MTKDNELPYDFDLLFDIKTEEDLKCAYLQKKQEIKIMEDIMKVYNIKYEEWHEHIV